MQFLTFLELLGFSHKQLLISDAFLHPIFKVFLTTKFVSNSSTQNFLAIRGAHSIFLWERVGAGLTFILPLIWDRVSIENLSSK